MSWRYVAGIDAAQGSVARTKVGGRHQGDDFAMATWRFKDEHPEAELVHLYRSAGLTDDQMSALIHRQHERFKYELMVLDPGGGGLFIRDKLREPIQNTGAETFQVVPIVTEDDDLMRGVGQPVLAFFSRSEIRIKRLGLVLTAESVLPNKAHELLRGALEASPPRVRFPAKWVGWSETALSHPDQMRAYLNDSRGLSGRGRASAEIDLALAQLNAVDRKLAPDMKTPETDKSGMYTFISSCKKDSAYALMYGHFGVWMLREEQAIIRRQNAGNDDFVCAVEEA